MSSRWLLTFLVLLSEALSSRRDTRIQFLKTQIEMLQRCVPDKRLIFTPGERLSIGADWHKAGPSSKRPTRDRFGQDLPALATRRSQRVVHLAVSAERGRSQLQCEH